MVVGAGAAGVETNGGAEIENGHPKAAVSVRLSWCDQIRTSDAGQQPDQRKNQGGFDCSQSPWRRFGRDGEGKPQAKPGSAPRRGKCVCRALIRRTERLSGSGDGSATNGRTIEHPRHQDGPWWALVVSAGTAGIETNGNAEIENGHPRVTVSVRLSWRDQIRTSDAYQQRRRCAWHPNLRRNHRQPWHCHKRHRRWCACSGHTGRPIGRYEPSIQLR